MTVKPIPDGYHTICPFIVIDGAEEVIQFLETTFEATVKSKTLGACRGDGSRPIKNAEVKVGSSMVMLADAREGAPANPVSLYCYVEDVDACHARAVAAGGKEIMPPMDMFYGDRHGGVVDPAGNSWYIASHIEDMSDEELQRRADEYEAQQ